MPGIIYYSVGGGLGHLTRARAVLHSLAITAKVNLVAASTYCLDPRVVDDCSIIRIPPELAGQRLKLQQYLQGIVQQIQPEIIFLDAFPGGIIGEWCDINLPSATRLQYLARLIHWPEYRKRLLGKVPELDISYMLEPLQSNHMRYLQQHSASIKTISLQDPPTKLSYCQYSLLKNMRASKKPLWIIVHSGPEQEIQELIRYSWQMAEMEGIQPQLLLVAPQKPKSLSVDIAYMNMYPASPLFSSADRIISGCGFNIMRQMRNCRAQHRYLPFLRSLDDQFARASRYRGLKSTGPDLYAKLLSV